MTERERAELLALLKNRFETHLQRHPGLTWATVAARLEDKPDALLSLAQMEASGGEPDVIGVDQATGSITFGDCAAESPDAAACATTAPRWTSARKPSRAAAPSTWPPAWASPC